MTNFSPLNVARKLIHKVIPAMTSRCFDVFCWWSLEILLDVFLFGLDRVVRSGEGKTTWRKHEK